MLLPLAELTDRELVALMASGREGGLACLYDRHATAVYSLALRVVRDPADAEEVTQDVFSQAWRTARTYDDGRGQVAAWLLMIARARALDSLRRRSRRLPPGDGEEAAIPDASPSVEYKVATEQQLVLARGVLQQLPAEQRHALELAYYEGMTHAEIAQQTATPLGTVKTRIRSALSSLRLALSGQATRIGEER